MDDSRVAADYVTAICGRVLALFLRQRESKRSDDDTAPPLLPSSTCLFVRLLNLFLLARAAGGPADVGDALSSDGLHYFLCGERSI